MKNKAEILVGDVLVPTNDHAEVFIKVTRPGHINILEMSFEEMVELQYSITSYMAGPRLDG